MRLGDSVGADGVVQTGLNEALRTQGYFLACQTIPKTDLTVRLASDADTSPATIASLELLSSSVLQVRLHIDPAFQFHAGQYVTLIRADGLGRCYSIANQPSNDNELEMHVRRVPQGQMSNWLFREARAGDPVRVRGPAGSCFYIPQPQRPQPILLAGTGTGLSPLFGILRDALVDGHTASIYLFHGASDPSRLYMQRELTALSEVFRQFHYLPSLLSDGIGGSLVEMIETKLPRLNNWRAYLCGNPHAVEELREHVFLCGIASHDIFTDAFLYTPSEAN